MLDQIPVTPAEDEAFRHLKLEPPVAILVFDESHRITDDTIHRALCVEEGCARCCHD